MQTQILKPLPKVILLNSNEEQEIELLLPNSNEYHTIKVITKQLTYKNNELVNTTYKLPIICNYIPSNKVAENSCKRYFISRLIERIKRYLIRTYKFYFSIKTVKELYLTIKEELDIFDSKQNIISLSCKLVVEYHKEVDNKVFTEEFVFSECSLLGGIKLTTSTTLPPDTWNKLKDFIHIPRNTIYTFNDKVISFKYKNKDYFYNIETNDLTW